MEGSFDRRFTISCLLLLIVWVSAVIPVGALDYFVGTTDDTNDGLCTPSGSPNPEICSLREALIEANATVDEDTIYLGAGTFSLTINGTGEDLAATGDLDIHEDVFIVGSGFSKTRIVGFANEPIFDMRFAAAPPYPKLELFDVTLSQARTGVAALRANVYLWRTLIENCQNDGVGVNDGVLLMVDSEIRELESSYGAVLIVHGDFFATRSTIADNTISVNDGAILCQFSNVSLVNTTVSGNTAGGGQPNFAGFHGTDCSTSIDSSSIVENEPYEIAVDPALPGTTVLRNTYLFGPCPQSSQGLISSQGGNVGSNNYSDQYCGLNDPTDQIVGGDSLVLPLGYFGGYTQTRLPFGIGPHPLVDNPNADAHCQATDQRGINRPQDGGGTVVACDTGAVERKPDDYTHYWGDGFESGDTGAWSSVVP